MLMPRKWNKSIFLQVKDQESPLDCLWQPGPARSRRLLGTPLRTNHRSSSKASTQQESGLAPPSHRPSKAGFIQIRLSFHFNLQKLSTISKKLVLTSIFRNLYHSPVIAWVLAAS
jgi:hypothetical protein